MPEKGVVFELDDRHLEVSVTLPSGRTVVLKKGEKRTVKDPAEIDIWRGAKGVRVASKPTRSASSKSSGSTTGSSTPQEGK